MIETNFRGEPIYMPKRPQEVKYATCSSYKARHFLNYETKTSLRTAVAKTTEYITSRGAKPFDYSYPLEIINEKEPKTWKDRLM